MNLFTYYINLKKIVETTNIGLISRFCDYGTRLISHRKNIKISTFKGAHTFRKDITRFRFSFDK